MVVLRLSVAKEYVILSFTVVRGVFDASPPASTAADDISAEIANTRFPSDTEAEESISDTTEGIVHSGNVVNNACAAAACRSSKFC